MKSHILKQAAILSVFIFIGFLALAYSKSIEKQTENAGNDGSLILKGMLAEDKIYLKGDQRFHFSLEMSAPEIFNRESPVSAHVDLVIVLDQSGSMTGRKINDAKEAILRLFQVMSPKDRIGLVGYSNDAYVYSDMVRMTEANKTILSRKIRGLEPMGSTNLGEGLRQAVSLISSARPAGNQAKIVLISDGLANQGITAVSALGNMASVSAKKEVPVSTVGVGTDFNEILMTHIADMGQGSYYYLETPETFYAAFAKELMRTRCVFASNVQIRIPLKNGLVLESAGGYPITADQNVAIFYPGDVLSGSTRKIFLTFRSQEVSVRKYHLSDIRADYRMGDHQLVSHLPDTFSIAYVDTREEAVSSINKGVWEDKVIQEDYNTLKEDVAALIRTGKKEKALEKISEYRSTQSEINHIMKSSVVSDNIEKDLPAIEQSVEDAFSGSEENQKKNSKKLQYEAYINKRSYN